MSANNFHFINGLWAVEDVEDDFDGSMAQDTIDNVTSELEQLPEFIDVSWLKKDDFELRSYPSTVIACFEVGGWVKELDKAFYIQVITRNGYYSGFNFDYNIIETDDNGYPEYYNDEIKTSQRNTDKINNLCNRITAIFSKYSTHLKCLGVASNGEAFYKIA
jgi:hypothetical protein